MAIVDIREVLGFFLLYDSKYHALDWEFSFFSYFFLSSLEVFDDIFIVLFFPDTFDDREDRIEDLIESSFESGDAFFLYSYLSLIIISELIELVSERFRFSIKCLSEIEWYIRSLSAFHHFIDTSAFSGFVSELESPPDYFRTVHIIGTRLEVISISSEYRISFCESIIEELDDLIGRIWELEICLIEYESSLTYLYHAKEGREACSTIRDDGIIADISYDPQKSAFTASIVSDDSQIGYLIEILIEICQKYEIRHYTPEYWSHITVTIHILRYLA